MLHGSLSLEKILQKLKTTTINVGQIDFNGKCNAKCWFCPVKYEDNPAEFQYQTTVSEMETILSNIRNSQLFPQHVDFLYTCHYNEILLYKHFQQMVELFRKYRFKTMILSNGTPLKPSVLDYINNNKDVITGIHLNIPAIEKLEWAAKAGFNESVHEVLIRNLRYLNLHYPTASIQVNMTYEGSLKQSATNDAQRIISEFKTLFPNLNVQPNVYLSDRAGRLTKEHKVLFRDKKDPRIVNTCTHSGDKGGRPFEWIHVNSKGDLFLCCDDYNMEYSFGNLLEQSFDDIWISEKHAQVIALAHKNICTGCDFAVLR